jgi:outer membrane protein OmpA-like peptidoglycan-associated protein
MKKMMTLALALLLGATLFNTGCSTLDIGDKTAKGAGIGALGGALVGGLWGAARGDWAKGAMIGAGVGAAAGAVTGVVLDSQEEKLKRAGIDAKRDEAGNLAVKMSEDALKFDVGKSSLSASGKQQLAELGGILKEYSENRIIIAGFTDSQGDENTNKNLSLARATTVQQQLMASGMPSKCIVQVNGFGEDPQYFIGDNATAAGRAQNRRVELRIGVDEAEAKINQDKRYKAKPKK